jgi:hypothetical protein
MSSETKLHKDWAQELEQVEANMATMSASLEQAQRQVAAPQWGKGGRAPRASR